MCAGGSAPGPTPTEVAALPMGSLARALCTQQSWVRVTGWLNFCAHGNSTAEDLGNEPFCFPGMVDEEGLLGCGDVGPE